MSREIPEPVRAAAGLAATVLDEVWKLPQTLPGLPVRAIGLAMQAALKVQQEYAGLVARGDELFTGIRGEREPGLATFDDDDTSPAPAATPPGFRDSAFDRTEAPPAETGADAALEEIAIEELVDASPAPAGADADALENALLENEAAAAGDAAGEPEVPTTAEVADASGVVDEVPAVVTDEGIATEEPATEEPATEEPATEEPATEEPATATDEGGTPVAAAADAAAVDDGAPSDGAPSDGAAPTAAAPRSEPVDGYDGFSIAQLRGRLRGYALSTVEELLAYEEATRAREPYARMLRNRLERLTAEAVEASPLAPRGA